MAKATQRCRACDRLCLPKNRGLCWRCYHNPDIRYLYAPFSFKKDDDGDFNGGYTLGSPTHHAPGTEGKIKVFIERLQEKISLFNPLDEVGDRESASLYHQRVS